LFTFEQVVLLSLQVGANKYLAIEAGKLLALVCLAMRARRFTASAGRHFGVLSRKKKTGPPDPVSMPHQG
jgi:hypothetical protein